jgi:hypothetical protein
VGCYLGLDPTPAPARLRCITEAALVKLIVTAACMPAVSGW